jgi:hypothetical protein
LIRFTTTTTDIDDFIVPDRIRLKHHARRLLLLPAGRHAVSAGARSEEAFVQPGKMLSVQINAL